MIRAETGEIFFPLWTAETTFVRTPNIPNQEKFSFPPPQHSKSLDTHTTQIGEAGLCQVLCQSDLQDLESMSFHFSLQTPKTLLGTRAMSSVCLAQQGPGFKRSLYYSAIDGIHFRADFIYLYIITLFFFHKYCYLCIIILRLTFHDPVHYSSSVLLI